ncbi:unnamed protein product [Gadus morhua 'NCC']
MPRTGRAKDTLGPWRLQNSGHPGLAWQTLPLPWPLASRALGGGCSCVAIKHAVSIQSAPLTMCQQHGSIEPPRPRPSPRPGGRGPQR